MEWTVAIGVDTHKQVHVAVALDALGGQLDSREIATTPAGYRALLSWSRELGVPAFAVEGAGSYGAGLVRFLEQAGVAVYESERPRRQERRRGKSDLIDAALAARRLLAGERLSLPRGGGRREDLRLLLLERRGAMQARTAALNQLSAVLLTAPEHVRRRLEALSGARLAREAARLRAHPEVVIGVLGRLGRRVERLSKELAETRRARRRGRARSARGVRRGARLRRPAARLQRRPRPHAKRGLLRRARRHEPNRCLQRQATTPPAQPRRRPPAQLGPAHRRPPTHPPPPETNTYYQRLLAAGKTTREARRCVKRALARHFYHRLRETPRLPLTT